MRSSVRFRLVAAFAITLGLVLVGIGLIVATQFRSERNAAVNAELDARAHALIVALPRAATSTLQQLLGTSDEHFGQVLDGNGVIASSDALGPRPFAADLASGMRTTNVGTTTEVRHARVLVVGSAGRTVIVMTALDDLDDSMRHLAMLLWLGGVATLVAASSLAWILAGAALAPVESMRAEAAGYTTTNLDGRLVVPSSDDELSRLAETLNAMLERIQSHVEEQRLFIDNASHELRTPLANLTLELELALRRHRSEAEVRAALESAMYETRRLNALASDLLSLSGGSDPLTARRRAPTDLATLVHETTASFRGRAEVEGVDLVDDAVAVSVLEVDAGGIRQALTNLLDNALRETPSGGTVTIRLSESPTEVTLAVHDTGPGLPPELGSHAFDLFSRGHNRGRTETGFGLGLGVVAGVARAHGGRAAIDQDQTGTLVSMTLVRPPASA